MPPIYQSRKRLFIMVPIQKSIYTLLIAGGAILPVMAASVDINVTGTVLPSACTPALSGGGVVDYKQIAANSLSETDYTLLPTAQLDFSISCGAPAKVAVRAIDGRPNTAAGASPYRNNGTVTAPVALFRLFSSMNVAGLGLDGNNRIGGYGLRIAGGSVIADGKSVNSLHGDAKDIWIELGAGPVSGAFYNEFFPWLSWAEAGTSAPLSFTQLSGKLEVQAYLNKASELNLSKPVVLDGLTTLELIYL